VELYLQSPIRLRAQLKARGKEKDWGERSCGLFLDIIPRNSAGDAGRITKILSYISGGCSVYLASQLQRKCSASEDEADDQP
jgi:hypothetical protein